MRSKPALLIAGMGDFINNYFENNYYMNKFLVLLIGAVMGVAGFLYLVHGFHNTHIVAVFDKLEPMPHKLNVYYKGFRIGRTVRVHPTNDFTNTSVDMVLNAKNLKLPDNTTAKVKRKDKKDYVELEYPTAPSITYLKNHSVIKGSTSFNISSYIDTQADNGGLDDLKDNLSGTVESAGETLNALTDLFKTADDILKDLRPSLKETGENLVITSRNLADVSTELNNSVRRDNRLDNSFANIELMTRNFEAATRNFQTASLNINDLTGNANRETIRLTNCVLKNVNNVVLNVNDIVKGFKNTLSKRFGGMRVFLGKAIEDDNCKK